MTDPTIYVANKSTQVSDADVAKMCAACTKQLATHVAPMFNLGPVPVTFLPKGAPVPPAPARIITIMDVLDDAQALGYHTEDTGGHIWGVVGTAEAMKQGAKALTGAYAISSILSHEVVELFADARINLWADNGRGLTIAYELCDPVENDFYLIDGVAVSSFVGPAWFDHLAEKTARFDYLGHLSKPFTMTHGGYWVQAKAGAVTQRFGDRFPEWRKAAKQAQFSRAQRRAASVPKPFPGIRIVNSGGVGRNTKVYIDGQDVSRCFRSVEITARLKDFVVATLEAVVVEAEFDGVQKIVMPHDGTRELLIKYGWTPPAESAS